MRISEQTHIAELVLLKGLHWLVCKEQVGVKSLGNRDGFHLLGVAEDELEDVLGHETP